MHNPAGIAIAMRPAPIDNRLPSNHIRRSKAPLLCGADRRPFGRCDREALAVRP
jgi:hypothetical protein